MFVLFGLLRDRTQAVAGLAIGTGVTAIIAHNDPKSGVGNFVFSTIVFTIAWTVGFGLGRMRHEAEAAQDRLRAGRTREGRTGAARRRGRAQPDRAGAPRRRRTQRQRDDRPGVGGTAAPQAAPGEGARGPARRRADRPRSARRDAAHGRRAPAPGGGAGARPPAEPRAPGPAGQHTRELGLPVELRVEGTPEPAPGERRPHRLPARPGGADQRDQARARRPRRGRRPLRRRPRRADGHRRRLRATAAATVAATAWSGCASGSPSTAASSKPGRWRPAATGLHARIPVS